MTIKEYAFRAHAHLKSVGAPSLTRSHTHELLAAAAGYATHAAFQHDALWCDLEWRLVGRAPDQVRIRDRCVQLGLDVAEAQRASDGLATFLATSSYAPVRFDELAAAVEGDDEDPDYRSTIASFVTGPILEDIRKLALFYPVLAEGLEAAAARGVPEAHMAIVHLLESLDHESEDHDEFAADMRRTGGWSAPFVSFEQVIEQPAMAVHKRRHHLLAAAQSGYVRALEWTSDRYGDIRVLKLPADQVDAGFMVEVAEDAGDEDMVRHWLTVSARQGDVSAMRRLIDEHDESLEQAWVWMHLSRLLDDDLSRDRHIAINPDGSEYDWDVGGPAEVGGDDGIELEPLASEQDRQARREASELFAVISSRPDSNR